MRSLKEESASCKEMALRNGLKIGPPSAEVHSEGVQRREKREAPRPPSVREAVGLMCGV